MNVQHISGGSAGRRRLRGGRAGAALLLTAALLGAAGCAGGAGAAEGGKNGDKSTGVATRPSKAEVTIAPKNGAKGVDTSGELEVQASRGKLTSVTVKDEDGTAVPGELSKGGTRWKPEGHLRTDTKYTVDAVAKDADGRRTTEQASFTTLKPKATFIGYFTPEDGSKVGVGMPVSIRFSRGITDPEAVEKGIEVTASPSVPVEGHWFGNDRLDFRPEKYWEPGTKVTLRLDLDGVEGRDGVYGRQAKTVKFTIGRSQVSVVDAKKKKMTVERDGKVIKTIRITSGSPSNPTYNGRMVISEKHRVTRMNGETVGFGDEYDIKDVPHAMRLSTSGTFIHGNYWAGQWTFGRQNVSHGCIGLHDARGGGNPNTPAAWFFRNSMIGDVVEVKNSKDKRIQPDNGLNGWNMDWEEWKKG